MAEKHAFLLLSILFLFMLACPCLTCLVTDTSSSSSCVVSDGVRDVVRETTVLHLGRHKISSDRCDPTYGFLPCTSSVVGNIFLVVVYGYLMFRAAKFLSSGSEILLEIPGPGIVGGLFLPVLGSLPDAIIILASGLFESKETARSQVSVGMGLLAGSTVMLLTLLWGSCVVVGKCDLVDSIAKDSQDTKGFSLTGSGVSTDIWTSYAARLMVISVIPFIIVQLPQVFHTNSQTRLAILVSLIVSVSLLLSYCLFQVFQPLIQKRRLAYVRHKHVMSGILKHLKMHALGRLLTDNGEPNVDVLRKLFKLIDKNSDESLSAAELRALIIGLQLKIDLDENDAVHKVMSDFGTSGDYRIDVNEFIRGISKWLDVATKHSTVYASDHSPPSINIIDDFHQQTMKEHYLLGDQNDDFERIKNPKWNASKAILMLLLGSVIAAAFADPLVDAVDNFSTATSIPSFFVSFVALPFVSSSEAVSALIFARRKKLRTSSLTFSEIYGAVTMNNVLCLSVFLGLVYFRQLTWDFSSEVLIILIVCIVMGVFASFRTTFPLWTCLVAYTLYPFSLVLVYVLQYVFGLS
ncbi:hypothetical protein L1049_024655 [Liquidambar formosana]|uniref:EF-hand domain-containing protein n=1 Tax=Liquidambar formosana TaxID=63359 RepID=A0AAP0RVI9_LIQFO